jgi:hypothetical protein
MAAAGLADDAEAGELDAELGAPARTAADRGA